VSLSFGDRNCVDSPADLPKFKDIAVPVMFPSVFTTEDIQKYDHLFGHADGNKDGYVDGNEAKLYFSKAKISQEKLAKIWELSELDGDSRLNYSEFRLAMHLIYWSLKNEDLPSAIPAELVQSAKSIPPVTPIPAAAPLSGNMGNQFNPSGSQFSFGNQPGYGTPSQPQNFGLQGNFGSFSDGNSGIMPNMNNSAMPNDMQQQQQGLYFQGNPGPMNAINTQVNYFAGNMPSGYGNAMPQGQMNQGMNQGMNNQGFISGPPKLADPSTRPAIHQYALPGASFEARANFQNDLSQAMNSRQQKK